MNQSLCLKYHKYSWKISKIFHFINKIKKNKFISLKWVLNISKYFFIIIIKKLLSSWLSHNEWWKDKKRRIMIRKYQYCNEWYFDFDYFKKSKLFFIKILLNQSFNSDIEDNKIFSLTLNKNNNFSKSSNDKSSYSNISIYSNDWYILKSFSQIMLL